ncbi:hypothetical protein N2152v2_010041 [Parachlorella kessleri]
MATNASLHDRIQQLEGEVERLQQHLGDLHCTDLNALRRAYRTLCQHIEALEQESEGVLGELRGLETDVLTPDVVATELGAVSGVSVGLALTHQALKITPLAAAGWLFRGMWAVGGAYIAWRLTAGTLARIAGMLGRNSRRKRSLEDKLQTVEDRIRIMVSLLSWSDAKGMPPLTPSQAALHQLLYPASLQNQELPRQERQLQPWLVSQPQVQTQSWERGPLLPWLRPAGQQQEAPSQAQPSTASAAMPDSGGAGSSRSDSLSGYGGATSTRSRSSSQEGEGSGQPNAALNEPRMLSGSRAALHAEAPAASARGPHPSSRHARSSSQTSIASEQPEVADSAEQGTVDGIGENRSGSADVERGISENSSSSSSSIKASAGSRASSGSSPGRARVQLELEPLMRYAQLGSSKGTSL